MLDPVTTLYLPVTTEPEPHAEVHAAPVVETKPEASQHHATDIFETIAPRVDERIRQAFANHKVALGLNNFQHTISLWMVSTTALVGTVVAIAMGLHLVSEQGSIRQSVTNVQKDVSGDKAALSQMQAAVANLANGASSQIADVRGKLEATSNAQQLFDAQVIEQNNKLNAELQAQRVLYRGNAAAIARIEAQQRVLATQAAKQQAVTTGDTGDGQQ